MIKLYNKEKNIYEFEKVAGDKFLKLLYESKLGRIPLNILVKRKLFSDLAGIYCDTQISKKKIKAFVKNYFIDIDESELKIEKFKTFNEFFSRKLKQNARNFKRGKDTFISPGDGRLKAWENINKNKVLQIKGKEYKIKNLLNNESLANEYDEGVCILLRLAPVDYHRFHFIDDGLCSDSKKIAGMYYSVNPVALKNIVEVFCVNKREYSIFQSSCFDKVIYVEVGATSVGSIIQTYKSKDFVKKGDEKGFFKFGGSTIILFVKKGIIKINKDILEHTKKGIETRVLAGEPIGIKINNT
jgi:phosphatidylserine decarboxylase